MMAGAVVDLARVRAQRDGQRLGLPDREWKEWAAARWARIRREKAELDKLEREVRARRRREKLIVLPGRA